MLPFKNRLICRQDFQKVLKGGAFFSLGEISCKTATNKKEFSRFALLVKAKNSGGAVNRNRVKRKMRAIIFKNLKKISPGRDTVFFYAFPKKPEEKNGKIEEKMLKLLRLSKLIERLN